MPPARRTPFLRILVPAIVGSAALSLTAGYTLGSSNRSGDLGPRQDNYIHGILYGTQLREDHQAWLNDPKRSALDVRAQPELRCASRYYPNNDDAMAGCIQGLDDPGNQHYQLPDPDQKG